MLFSSSPCRRRIRGLRLGVMGVLHYVICCLTSIKIVCSHAPLHACHLYMECAEQCGRECEDCACVAGVHRRGGCWIVQCSESPGETLRWNCKLAIVTLCWALVREPSRTSRTDRRTWRVWFCISNGSIGSPSLSPSLLFPPTTLSGLCLPPPVPPAPWRPPPPSSHRSPNHDGRISSFGPLQEGQI